MITKIRAKILAEVLNSDLDRAKKLVALEAEEAVRQSILLVTILQWMKLKLMAL